MRGGEGDPFITEVPGELSWLLMVFRLLVKPVTSPTFGHRESSALSLFKVVRGLSMAGNKASLAYKKTTPCHQI